jgi:hypothetical protein
MLEFISTWISKRFKPTAKKAERAKIDSIPSEDEISLREAENRYIDLQIAISNFADLFYAKIYEKGINKGSIKKFYIPSVLTIVPIDIDFYDGVKKLLEKDGWQDVAVTPNPSHVCGILVTVRRPL